MKNFYSKIDANQKLWSGSSFAIREFDVDFAFDLNDDDVDEKTIFFCK